MKRISFDFRIIFVYIAVILLWLLVVILGFIIYQDNQSINQSNIQVESEQNY